MTEALSATAHDLLVGLALALAAVALLYLLVRSNRALRRREEARGGGVRVERVGGERAWPPRPRPACHSCETTEFHPRAHEAVVPGAGRRTA